MCGGAGRMGDGDKGVKGGGVWCGMWWWGGLGWEEGRKCVCVSSLHLLDPSEWTLAAYGGFFREENIIVLEARPSCTPSGMRRVGIHRDAAQSFLTILRLCWRSAKDVQTILHCFQLCVVCRLFDRDYDPEQIPSSCSCTALHTHLSDTDERPRLFFSLTDESGWWSS